MKFTSFKPKVIWILITDVHFRYYYWPWRNCQKMLSSTLSRLVLQSLSYSIHHRDSQRTMSTRLYSLYRYTNMFCCQTLVTLFMYLQSTKQSISCYIKYMYIIYKYKLCRMCVISLINHKEIVLLKSASITVTNGAKTTLWNVVVMMS